jgi:RecA-family ATPase
VIDATDAPAPPHASGLFERNTEDRKEILEGLLREGQLAAFAGPFGMGKSPVLLDLTVRFIHGIEWCGRRVDRRPVVAIDCETPGPEYRRAISAIAARFQTPIPNVPQDLDIYLERDNPLEPGTAELLKAVTSPTHGPKLALIAAALRRKPTAVVFIDPLEMFFRLDTCKKAEVLELYRDLRTLLTSFPKAAMVNTFNLRKRDKRTGKASLLAEPRDWLEEVCGSLDLLNRSDARLGIDEYRGEDTREVLAD